LVALVEQAAVVADHEMQLAQQRSQAQLTQAAVAAVECSYKAFM
jgi:hypothetical protein